MQLFARLAATAAFSAFMAGCSIISAPQQSECSWQGDGVYEGYKAFAYATVEAGEVATFKVIGHAAAALDRPEGTCTFDLATIPPRQVERRENGVFRILSDQGEGLFYVSASANWDRIAIDPIGVPCASGTMPRSVHILSTSSACKIEW